MKQIGIGVIGWGFMGRTHTFSIKTMPLHYNLDFEPRLIGICSRRLEKAEQAARGDIACTIIEVDAHISPNIVAELRALPDIISVRAINVQ